MSGIREFRIVGYPLGPHGRSGLFIRGIGEYGAGADLRNRSRTDLDDPRAGRYS